MASKTESLFRGLLALCGVVLLVLFVVSQLDVGRGSEPLEPEPATGESGTPFGDAQLDLSESAPALGRDARLAVEGKRELDEAKGEAPRRGRLEFQVVDDTSGAPLADLAWIAFCEQRQDEILGHGRTDAEGRAALDGLPENTVVITTERRPPNRSGWHAVWLSQGERERAVVRVPSGGALTGRVVDELGEARAGIEVALAGGPTAWLRSKSGSRAQLDLEQGWFGQGVPQPVAVTDADGRFRVEHVSSLPRGVWVVDGRPRPSQWKPVELELWHPGLGAGYARKPGAQVKDGETVDLGDLELTLEVHYGGTLRTAEGRPAIGVLVNTPRWGVRPEQGWGELKPRECLTDSAGRFRFSNFGAASGSRQGSAKALVPDGSFENFPLPELGPGGRALDLAWTLDPTAILVLHAKTLDDEPAEPIRTVGLGESYRPRSSILGPPLTGAFVQLISNGEFRGTMSWDELAPGDGNSRTPGELRIPLGDELQPLESVRLRMAGYRSREVELGFRVAGVVERTVPLERLPRLALELEVLGLEVARLEVARLEAADAERTGQEPEPLYLDLQFCASRELVLQRGRGESMDCCGLGGNLVVRLWDGPPPPIAGQVREPVLASFAVASDAPLWVAVRPAPLEAASLPEGEPLLFGPFTPAVPGAEPVPELIQLPYEHIVFRAASGAPAKGATEPPPVLEPGDVDPRETEPEDCAVIMTIVDAETGAPLEERARVVVFRQAEAGESDERYVGRGQFGDTEHHVALVSPGASYRFEIRTQGYAAFEVGPREITLGAQRVDLGTLRLRPLPSWTLHLVAPGGDADAGGRLRLFERGVDGGFVEQTAGWGGPVSELEGGGWRIHGEGGDDLWVRLSQSGRNARNELDVLLGGGVGARWLLPLGRVRAGDEVARNLPPTGDVRWELTGIPPVEAGARPALRLYLLEADGRPVCGHAPGVQHDLATCSLTLGKGVYDSGTGTVVYRITTGVGDYELVGSGVLYSVAPRRVTIARGDGEIVHVLPADS